MCVPITRASNRVRKEVCDEGATENDANNRCSIPAPDHRKILLLWVGAHDCKDARANHWSAEQGSDVSES